jgi:farnesyl-diphosphate farnesyltransferase
MSAISRPDRDYCIAVLPLVSRTFAICIRFLPSRVEYAVLVAYLLCRIADTIEDAVSLAPLEKQRLLARLREYLEEGAGDARELSTVFAGGGADDARLAANADVVLREFRRLPREQRDVIRPWVQEMCAGMGEFAGRSQGSGHLQALGSVEDLDRYCYFVAGTVGHLLTELFSLHYGRQPDEHYQSLKSLATSFGLGLQLTNIIKDLADDRRRGWSFVPRQLTRLAGIDPEQMQQPGTREQSRQVMEMLIAKAGAHLRDALDYCTQLPRSQYRIRLFCLTSLYFAVRTLRRARHDPRLLDPEHKVKISRAEVYRTVFVTHLVAPVDGLVRAYFNHLAGGVRAVA